MKEDGGMNLICVWWWWTTCPSEANLSLHLSLRIGVFLESYFLRRGYRRCRNGSSLRRRIDFLQQKSTSLYSASPTDILCVCTHARIQSCAHTHARAHTYTHAPSISFSGSDKQLKCHYDSILLRILD